MANTYNLTQLLASGSNQGSLPNRLYQIWQNAGDYPKIRRHAFQIGGPEWNGVAPVIGDIVKVLELGPYTTGGSTAGNVEYVIAGFVNVITASAVATSVANLGDTGTATQYLTGAVLTTVGFTISPFTTAKVYTAADFLQLVTATATGSGAVVDCGVISFSIQTANTNL